MIFMKLLKNENSFTILVGDTNSDGKVDLLDLVIVAKNFGATS